MKKIKDFIKKYFITGLLVIIPVWATYYVLTGLLSVIDGLLGDLLEYYIGYTFPGLGIITLIIFILLVGVLSANYIGNRLVRYSDRLMQKVPVVRGIYTTVKQIMETFSLKQNFHGVALVECPRKGSYSIGFVTAHIRAEEGGADASFMTVFVPTTPNPTTGFLLILPQRDVTLLDMTVEQGMKFIISLGLVPLPGGEVARLMAAAKQERPQ